MTSLLPPRIAIITGSTRPGRQSPAVARWVHEIADRRADSDWAVVDIADHDLPHLDEPLPPLAATYTHPHTRRWAATIAAFDGFVFVTPEYNHSAPAALKNAIDFLFAEWNDKAAGFVSYGVEGGQRAVEHLRGVMGELKVADVRSQVSLRFGEDFEGFDRFVPGPGREEEVDALLDDVVAWTAALRSLREPRGDVRPLPAAG